MPIVTPKGPDSSTTATTQPSASRERAIAKLMEAAPPNKQETPVQNPNKIAAEEITGNLPLAQEAESVGQSSTTEGTAAKAPETPAEPAKDPLSAHYATLARKEKALRAKVMAQEAELKAKEEAFKAREAAIAAKEREYQESYIRKDKLTQDPLTTLQEAGLTYDQLTEMALQSPQDGQVRAAINKIQADMEARVKAIEEKHQKLIEAQEAQQQNAYKQALNQIRTDVKKLVFTNEAFETIKETGATEDVVELIERTYKEDGVLMTVEEAAQAVEDYLVEEAVKIAKTKKIQSRLQPKQETTATGAKPPTQAVEATPPKQPQKTTLNNSMSASRPLTAKERAVLAFKGELKKD